MNSKEDSTVVLYEGQILTSISSWKGQKRLSGSGGFEGAICRTQLNVLVPAEAVQERKGEESSKHGGPVQCQVLSSHHTKRMQYAKSEICIKEAYTPTIVERGL
jgi:hypothetical protein